MSAPLLEGLRGPHLTLVAKADKCDEILKTGDYAGEQTGIGPEDLGKNDVYFLPYL